MKQGGTVLKLLQNIIISFKLKKKLNNFIQNEM